MEAELDFRLRLVPSGVAPSLAIICVNRSESELVLAILVEMLKRFEMLNKNVTKQLKHVSIIHLHFFSTRSIQVSIA